eukprot:6190328-Pleurochrysis_carterae.AAC.3
MESGRSAVQLSIANTLASQDVAASKGFEHEPISAEVALDVGEWIQSLAVDRLFRNSLLPGRRMDLHS